MNYKLSIKSLALLLLAVAAGSSAWAEDMYLREGKSYLFSGTPAAAATGAITYQWYRNGTPIAGATNADYSLTPDLAYGWGDEFKRGVTSSTCPGDVAFSNIFTIYFHDCDGLYNPESSTCWALTNSIWKSFVERSDMYTTFFQWNRNVSWDATASTVSEWNSTPDDDDWSDFPCPNGWRLPEVYEFQSLVGTGSKTTTGGGQYGAATPGVFLGPNAAICTLPDNMTGCIFLPAGGYRSESSGDLVGTSDPTYAVYWIGKDQELGETRIFFFNINENEGYPDFGGARGANMRCVK